MNETQVTTKFLVWILSMYPILQKKLEVHRVDWPRPRAAVIDEVGPENQSLPLIVLAEGKGSKHQAGSWQGRAFLANKDAILQYLAEEYGIPEPHP